MLFLRNVLISDAPWSIHDREQGTVIDLHGRLVAIVPKGPPSITASSSLSIGSTLYPVPKVEGMDPRFHPGNTALIAAAPELLAALKEAAYKLDMLGQPPSEQFYDLINRASGPDSPAVTPVNQAKDSS